MASTDLYSNLVVYTYEVPNSLALPPLSGIIRPKIGRESNWEIETIVPKMQIIRYTFTQFPPIAFVLKTCIFVAKYDFRPNGEAVERSNVVGWDVLYKVYLFMSVGVKKTNFNKDFPGTIIFLLEILRNENYGDIIRWTNSEGEFKLVNAEEVARMWGLRKNKSNMNYDKLSRALRYYYDKNIIRKVLGQKFVYRFVSIPAFVKLKSTKSSLCDLTAESKEFLYQIKSKKGSHDIVKNTRVYDSQVFWQSTCSKAFCSDFPLNKESKRSLMKAQTSASYDKLPKPIWDRSEQDKVGHFPVNSPYVYLPLHLPICYFSNC